MAGPISLAAPWASVLEERYGILSVLLGTSAFLLLQLLLPAQDRLPEQRPIMPQGGGRFDAVRRRRGANRHQGSSVEKTIGASSHAWRETDTVSTGLGKEREPKVVVMRAATVP